MNELQKILKEKRKQLKLSLREAGDLIGISHSYLSTLEKGIDPRNGSPVRPTPDTLRLISWERNKTGIVLYQKLNKNYRYEDYPEETLGQKIKKQRLLQGLTAAELGKLCNRKEVTINFYESDIIQPDYTVMQKLCKLFNVPIEYFDDDYYTFVLSDGYEEFLREWRKKNTKRHYDIKKKLGVSFWSYNEWEKGRRMSRETFEKIREKLGI